MKRIPLYILATLIFATPLTAQAYCCWNEAICKSVCGSRCCGSNDFVSGSGKAALGGIAQQDLEREITAARDCDPRIRNALSRQTRIRTAPPPGRYSR